MKTNFGLPGNASPQDQPVKRHIFRLPGTRLGWWSFGLAVGFFVFFGLFQALVASGQRGGATFFSNPWLALSMLIAAGSAIGGGGTAAVAIFWRRERSVFSFFALLLGLIVLFFTLGELAFPH